MNTNELIALKRTIAELIGQASAFRLLDPQASDKAEQILAAKLTGEEIETTLKRIYEDLAKATQC